MMENDHKDPGAADRAPTAQIRGNVSTNINNDWNEL